MPHVGDFVEGLHQAQLHACILLGLAKRAAPAGGPGFDRPGMKEDADRIRRFAVGGHVEDKFGGGRFGVTVKRRPFADEVILVNVSRLSGVSLDAANGHRATALSASHAGWPPPSPS